MQEPREIHHPGGGESRWPTVLGLIGLVVLPPLIASSPRILFGTPLSARLSVPGSEAMLLRETYVISIEGPDRCTVHSRAHEGLTVRVIHPTAAFQIGDPIQVRGTVTPAGEILASSARTHRYRWHKILISIPGALLLGFLLVRDFRPTRRGLARRIDEEAAGA
jgi:hypothetical protein